MNIQEAAEQFFGITANYKEAGYILPDGTMLDLSGKHLVSPQNYKYQRGRREVDHRELGGENYNGFSLEPYIGTGNGDELMCKFMTKAGAMRVDFNAHIASTIVMPTSKQIQTLYYGLRGSWVCLSAWTKTGDLIDDVELDTCSIKKLTEWFSNNVGGNSSGIRASTMGIKINRPRKVTAFKTNDLVNYIESKILSSSNIKDALIGISYVRDTLEAIGATELLTEAAVTMYSRCGLIDDIALELELDGKKFVDETTINKYVRSVKKTKCRVVLLSLLDNYNVRQAVLKRINLL